MRDPIQYIKEQIEESRKFVEAADKKRDEITKSYYEGRIDAYERILKWHLQRSNLK